MSADAPTAEESVRFLHQWAMKLADDMHAARYAGNHKAARVIAREATATELRAAAQAFDRDVSLQTRRTLLESACALAREVDR